MARIVPVQNPIEDKAQKGGIYAYNDLYGYWAIRMQRNLGYIAERTGDHRRRLKGRALQDITLASIDDRSPCVISSRYSRAQLRSLELARGYDGFVFRVTLATRTSTEWIAPYYCQTTLSSDTRYRIRYGQYN